MTDLKAFFHDLSLVRIQKLEDLTLSITYMANEFSHEHSRIGALLNFSIFAPSLNDAFNLAVAAAETGVIDPNKFALAEATLEAAKEVFKHHSGYPSAGQTRADWKGSTTPDTAVAIVDYLELITVALAVAQGQDASVSISRVNESLEMDARRGKLEAGDVQQLIF